MCVRWRSNRFRSNGMQGHPGMSKTAWISTHDARSSARSPAGEQSSPAVHRFSTAHPEASVEIIALILSLKDGSLATMRATFSQA